MEPRWNSCTTTALTGSNRAERHPIIRAGWSETALVYDATLNRIGWQNSEDVSLLDSYCRQPKSEITARIQDYRYFALLGSSCRVIGSI